MLLTAAPHAMCTIPFTNQKISVLLRACLPSPSTYRVLFPRAYTNQFAPSFAGSSLVKLPVTGSYLPRPHVDQPRLGIARVPQAAHVLVPRPARTGAAPDGAVDVVLPLGDQVPVGVHRAQNALQAVVEVPKGRGGARCARTLDRPGLGLTLKPGALERMAA